MDDVDRATPVPAFRLRTVPGETKSAVSLEAVEPLASPCWTAFHPAVIGPVTARFPAPLRVATVDTPAYQANWKLLAGEGTLLQSV